ncbi:MAG: hypothetical protein V2B20_17530 [Pseudomonadota bacterium]
MARPFLKDSKSKDELYEWIKSGILTYSKNSLLCWADEDFLCGHFFSSISGTCSFNFGNFDIKSYKLRGRGPSAPEKVIGADGIGIVILKYQDIHLKGFFLYQAKKAKTTGDGLGRAKEECDVMLTHTPASYLLVLMPTEVKMIGAMAVSANAKKSPSLNNLPFLSYPRFVVEHLLHGIMLEPLKNLRPTLSVDLNSEIKNITAVIGGSEKYIDEVSKKLEQELSNILEMDDQRNDDNDIKNENEH